MNHRLKPATPQYAILCPTCRRGTQGDSIDALATNFVQHTAVEHGLARTYDQAYKAIQRDLANAH